MKEEPQMTQSFADLVGPRRRRGRGFWAIYRMGQGKSGNAETLKRGFCYGGLRSVEAVAWGDRGIYRIREEDPADFGHNADFSGPGRPTPKRAREEKSLAGARNRSHRASAPHRVPSGRWFFPASIQGLRPWLWNHRPSALLTHFSSCPGKATAERLRSSEHPTCQQAKNRELPS
jgi:hypothetical protein